MSGCRSSSSSSSSRSSSSSSSSGSSIVVAAAAVVVEVVVVVVGVGVAVVVAVVVVPYAPLTDRGSKCVLRGCGGGGNYVRFILNCMVTCDHYCFCCCWLLHMSLS